GAIAIGTLTRNAAVLRDAALARHQPLVTEAIAQVAHPQIRNRGTLGGNLAHADPASEMPAVMLALGATLVVQSTRGERQIAARDFFRGVFTTALEPDEALVEIRLPAHARGTGTAFLEVARRAGDYAMMGVAAMVTVGADGRCTDARLAFCGAGETPGLASVAAKALIGERIDVATATAAGATAQGEIDPMGNVHATVAYQRHLAGVLTRRALIAAAQRALA
ncbi:MAG: FAD binding domain-containing protein, partial [Burkholderiales bacterium]